MRRYLESSFEESVRPRGKSPWTVRDQCDEREPLDEAEPASSGTANLPQIASTLSLIAEKLASRGEEQLRLMSMQTTVQLLSERLEGMAATQPALFPIQTFAPAPIELLKPLSIVVRCNGSDFIASFIDGNINASGDNEVEAVENLKDLLAATFETLDRDLKPEQLGPGPKKQLAAIRQFLKWA